MGSVGSSRPSPVVVTRVIRQASNTLRLVKTGRSIRQPSDLERNPERSSTRNKAAIPPPRQAIAIA
jgi:hypothetical protein